MEDMLNNLPGNRLSARRMIEHRSQTIPYRLIEDSSRVDLSRMLASDIMGDARFFRVEHGDFASIVSADCWVFSQAGLEAALLEAYQRGLCGRPIECGPWSEATKS